MEQSEEAILDACCGSRMFWFDRQNKDVIFMDKRSESHRLKDKSNKGGFRTLEVRPDVVADFTAIPYPDDSFRLVVFDPPHFTSAGAKGWLAKKYGSLGPDWKKEIKAGFLECLRVLEAGGILVFKWNEYQVPLSVVLKLAPCQPLFGNRKPAQSKTHWLLFMKPTPTDTEKKGGE